MSRATIEPRAILSAFIADPLRPIAQFITDDKAACSYLSSLVNGVEPLARGKVGVAYLLRIGQRDLVAKISPNVIPESEYHRQEGKSLPCPCHCVRQEGEIALDEFTNEAFIAYALEALLSQRGLPPFSVRHLLDLRCQESLFPEFTAPIGMSFIEYCDLGDLAHFGLTPETRQYLITANVKEDTRSFATEIIAPSIMVQIIRQVLCALDALSSLSFVSGDAKAGNILVQRRSIHTQYKGVPLRSEFTVKIADYGKSSLTLTTALGAVRLYNHSTLASLYNRFDSFYPEVVNGYYRIQESTDAQLFAHLRHSGHPYYSSFDAYTALVSLMLQPRYYYSLFSVNRLKRVWEQCWLNSEEASLIDQRIRDLWGRKDAERYAGAVDVLRGVKLKCDLYAQVLPLLREL